VEHKISILNGSYTFQLDSGQFWTTATPEASLTWTQFPEFLARISLLWKL